jgi:2,5-diketo-D-gluconate reductase A
MVIGVSEAQLLLRWAVQQGWPVLPKSSRSERVAVNLDMFGFDIEQSDIDAMCAMDRGLAMA